MTSPTPTCGTPRSHRSTCCTGLATTRLATRWPSSSNSSSARPSPASAGMPAQVNRTGAAPCGPSSSMRSAPSVRMPRCGADVRRCTPPISPTARRSPLIWSARSWPWPLGPAATAEYELFSRALRHAPTPQEEVRYLFALPGPAMRTSSGARWNRPWRDPHPERAVHGRHRPGHPLGGRRGLGVAEEPLGRGAWRGSRKTRVPHAGGSGLLDRASTAEDVQEFMAHHPVHHAQHLVAQTLERLAINTAFRRRRIGRAGGSGPRVLACGSRCSPWRTPRRKSAGRAASGAR